MGYKGYKGKFIPKNPKKYKGDSNNIIYRSSWEYAAFSYLDNNPDILYWSSEEVIIPYYSEIDNKNHRYFVDLYYKNSKGEEWLIEIKPQSQTIPPKPKRNKKKLLEEVLTYEKNKAKWIAANSFCKTRGWNFSVWTEVTLKNIGLKIL